MARTPGPRFVRWIGSARKDMRALPAAVKRTLGYALFVAQCGGKHPDAKPLRGFGDAGVLEVVEDHEGDSYRAAYTVRFAEVVYVLHAFQKKSKRGISTPKSELYLIERRLLRAKEDYEQWQETQRSQ